MSTVRIAALADASEHIQALACAHVQAFGGLLPDWSRSDAAAELRAHTGDADLPMTWVALEGDDWVGSVSLLQEDHPQIPQYSPWLATLYVRPSQRGRGVGARLVAHCVATAAQLQLPWLYLYCEPGRVGFYRRLGWQWHADLPLGPLQVVVMRVAPQPHRYAEVAVRATPVAAVASMPETVEIEVPPTPHCR